MRRAPLARLVAVAFVATACLREAPPEERTALVRELVRARGVEGDTLPLDGCAVDRFLADVPAWRDSLEPAERARIADDAPCATEPVRRAGRWTIVRWHRTLGGDFVIRGALESDDEEITFERGVVAGRRMLAGESTLGAAAAAAVARDSQRAPVRTAPPVVAADTARAALVAESAAVRAAITPSQRTTRDALRRDSLVRDSLWRDSIARVAVAREAARRDSLRRVIDARTRRSVDSMLRGTPAGPPRP